MLDSSMERRWGIAIVTYMVNNLQIKYNNFHDIGVKSKNSKADKVTQNEASK